MEVLWIVLGVLFVLALWVAALFNGLVRLRNHCAESWADIDTELRRRYDLIPNLVACVKGYANHEKEVLDRVLEARKAAQSEHGSLKDQARDENALVGSLRRLFAVAEGYPDLKASGNFLQLQEELVNTEDRIQRARRFYNANVRDLNTRIEVFPSNAVAGLFGFKKRDYYEIEDASVRTAPKVDVRADR